MQVFPTSVLWFQLEEFHIDGIALSGSKLEETWSGMACDVTIKSWEARVPSWGQNRVNTPYLQSPGRQPFKDIKINNYNNTL